MPKLQIHSDPPEEKQSALPTGEVTIPLPERFTFHSHREFRAAYCGDPPSRRSYAVDFFRTKFIDSAGLGMILQLVEHVDNDPNRLRLVNVAPEVKAILLIAGFGHLPIT